MDGWLVEFNAASSMLYPLVGPGWRKFGWERLPDGRIRVPKVYGDLEAARRDARTIRKTWPDLRVRIREK